MLRLVSTIQLLAISLRSKPCTVSGSSSAIFQLPSQISRSGGSAESGVFPGQRRLGGKTKSWPGPAAGGVCMAVLPRGSCLKDRAISELCVLELPLPRAVRRTAF